MFVTTLTIKGFRGFAEEQILSFAQPTGQDGSGITILVGPNNGGKSTVTESLQAWSRRNATSTEGKRNKLAEDRVSIRIKLQNDVHELWTAGGSTIIREPTDHQTGHCYVLPSRRFFTPYFGSGQADRQQYLNAGQLPSVRSTAIDEFAGRLFSAQQNLAKFNVVLERVVNPAPTWFIDQSDQGQYYVKLDSNGQYHSSDGLGEGIVSLLFVVDALYDSQAGDIIVIDEPELSLHPAYQRLAALLADYAKDRQIVYATHSPYFVDFNLVLNGAEVARVHKTAKGSTISQLKRETAERFKGLLKNEHNPHVLGLDAREVFFQEDGIVVVEGQEDVVRYPTVLKELVGAGKLTQENASCLRERFFGWGAGGASNIKRIVALLCDLGFERVAGIFDKNQCHLIPDLRAGFSNYTFLSIPADDIRTKPATEGKEPICGLLDDSGALGSEYVDEVGALFNDVAERLCGNLDELAAVPSNGE